MPRQHDIGPQVAGETGWIARMRFHQSWWRANILRAPPRGGEEGDPARYGNNLTDQDAAVGLNFLDKYCLAAYRAHSKAGVRTDRAEVNLLSSQPMCFNLFGPLALSPELAAPLLAASLHDVGRSVDVQIEWQQSARPDLTLLQDQTAFDAFIEYSDSYGRRCLLGIETKLTEPFSQTEPEHVTRYTRISAKHPEIFPEDVEPLKDLRWFQLWRNHLLALALAEEGAYDAFVSAVVYHPRDLGCVAAIEGYQELLGDDSSLLAWPLDTIVAAWKPIVADNAARASWLDAFERRYLDLDVSEAAWEEQRAAQKEQ